MRRCQAGYLVTAPSVLRSTLRNCADAPMVLPSHAMLALYTSGWRHRLDQPSPRATPIIPGRWSCGPENCPRPQSAVPDGSPGFWGGPPRSRSRRDHCRGGPAPRPSRGPRPRARGFYLAGPGFGVRLGLAGRLGLGVQLVEFALHLRGLMLGGGCSIVGLGVRRLAQRRLRAGRRLADQITDTRGL